MTPATDLVPEFVTAIPDVLQPGLLYVCLPYGTVQHLCACGCGHQVSTPLSPTAWKIIYDGETLSLRPSIGNWSFPCQSHYFIEHNRVRWSTRWSAVQIEENRERSRRAANEHLEHADTGAPKSGRSARRNRWRLWGRR